MCLTFTVSSRNRDAHVPHRSAVLGGPNRTHLTAIEGHHSVRAIYKSKEPIVDI